MPEVTVHNPKLQGQFVESWSDKERWCLYNLTLGSKLPLDVIEVCDRSKAMGTKGKSKIYDAYVDISGTRYFKNRKDGNADFTAGLVSNGGCYSWYEGSTEGNAFLLEKAGFVPHEHCTPYLAHVKANPDCKVDMELFRTDMLDVKIPESSGSKERKAKATDNERKEQWSREAANDIQESR